MTAALNAALSFAVASYARSEPTPATVVIRDQKLVKVERPKKAQPAKAPKLVAQPVEAAAKPTNPSPNGKVPVVALPATGTLSAKGFIMMMNRAKDRNEMVCAIAGFIGYNARLSFAENEMAAKAAAKQQISPVSAEGPSRAERQQANRSVTGYVSGMPNNQRKIVQDLLGRENLAVDTRNRLVRGARTDKSLSWNERKLRMGLARIEQERLAQIRADLARYVG